VKTGSTPKAGIVALHGAMSHAGWFERLGQALSEHGVLFRGINRRGCGPSPIQEGRDDPDMWIEDTTRAIAEMREQTPVVALMGWCWGARLALAAQDAGAGADRMILAAPGLAMSEAVLARFKESFDSGVDPLPQPFGPEDFSTSSEVVSFIRNDPWKWRGQSRSFVRSSREILQRALAVRASTWPTLVVLATDDLIVNNDKLRELFPGTDLRTIEGGHGLVLEHPAAIAALFADWLG
jgi:pimeloyl-ACP methyl ester carboxylesterase